MRVAAEPPALDPALRVALPTRPATAATPPRSAPARSAAVDLSRPRRQPGHQPHRAPQHQRRAGHLPARRPPLVVAVAAEELLQVVVRPRQVRPRRSREQPRPVAPPHLQEVLHRLAPARRPTPGAGVIAPSSPLNAAGPRRRPSPLLAEDVRRPVHPAEGQPGSPATAPPVASRPARIIPCSRVSSVGQPPFAATRSRLAAIARQPVVQLQPRGLQRRPAVVGQRRCGPPRSSPGSPPPRRPSRPSTCRSIGRTPRTFFFSSFLAWRSAS